ncbi:hypothetical protein D3C75_790970 [compost metagenome]
MNSIIFAAQHRKYTIHFQTRHPPSGNKNRAEQSLYSGRSALFLSLNGDGSCHFPASLCTISTEFCAVLAMCIFEHLAIFGARFANERAQLTVCFRKHAVPAHKLSRLKANFRTIIQHLDHRRSGLYVRLFEACSKTFFASLGAFQASLDTIGIMIWSNRVGY